MEKNSLSQTGKFDRILFKTYQADESTTACGICLIYRWPQVFKIEMLQTTEASCQSSPTHQDEEGRQKLLWSKRFT